MIRSIVARELSLVADGQMSSGSTPNSVTISYRNLTKVYLRVYAADWQMRYLHNDAFAKLRRANPVAVLEASLKDHGDFLSHEQEVLLPALSKGFYIVVASGKRDFSEGDNVLATARIAVTNLAMVFEQHSNRVLGRVLDAITGAPVEGASVAAWHLQEGEKRRGGTVQSDALGRFELKPSGLYGVSLVTEKGDDRNVSPDELYLHNQDAPRDWEERRALVFTDRALYRPGHLIQYKVLLFGRSSEREEYHPLSNTETKLELRDANSQRVTEVTLRTNEMGSAAGSFAAPTGRLLGQYSLNLVDGVSGGSTVRVEEYKRPKFQVRLNEPTEPPVLGGTMRITGVATSYSGVPIAHAPVSFQVRRAMRIPWWERVRCWALFSTINQADVELVNAKTVTDGEGKFSIEFIASEEKSVAEAKGVVFAFSVRAAVLNGTGEERSGEILVNAGFSDRQAAFEPSDNLYAPFPLKVTLTTLSGKPLKIDAGDVKIVRLESPARVERSDRQVGGWRATTDRSDWRLWKNGAQVFASKLSNVESGSVGASVSPTLAPGAYRAIFATKDGRGKDVSAEYPFLVLDGSSAKFPIALPHHVAVRGERPEMGERWDSTRGSQATVSVGKTFEAIWGTGYDAGRAFVEVFHRGKLIESYYTSEKSTQTKISIPIKEEHRGGLHLRITYVREHRFYSNSIVVDVPWDNKELKIEKAVYRPALKPGQGEEWTLRILGPNAKVAAAELVATLYDASLDAIFPHAWSSLQGIWPRDPAPRPLYPPFRKGQSGSFGNGFSALRGLVSTPGERYPDFAPFVEADQEMFYGSSGFGGGRRGGVMLESMEGGNSVLMSQSDMEAPGAPVARGKIGLKARSGSVAPTVDVPQSAKVRTNFNETALFFPQLETNGKGVVTLRFSMPDALTTWRFLAFAHSKTLQSASLSDTAVTSRELMVEPNLPRFLRSGDRITLVARLSNTTAKGQAGEATLRLRDVDTREDITSKFIKGAAQPFSLAGNAGTTLGWEVVVPDDFARPLAVEIVAQSKGFSDGEELVLPVLSPRVFLSEAKTFSLRKPGKHSIGFDALRDSAKRPALRHAGATVEYTANANWTVVQALTYLVEYPYECVEQTFNRLYANVLGGHIVAREPAIAKAFAEWRKSGQQLQSPLERNESLKNVANTEMPWLLEAQAETAARHRLANLFDVEAVRSGTASALKKLFEMQAGDGSWSWYPGGRGDLFMTMYVVAGMGRLERLDASFAKLFDAAVAEKRERALRWVDGEMARIHREELFRNKKLKPYASSLSAQYLYMRSFYPRLAVASSERASFDFWKSGAKKEWGKLSLMNQAQVATAFLRIDERKRAKAIVATLRERSLRSEEMGVWWGEYARTRGWWFDAPVETQAELIELFSELGETPELVSDMKVWLVQQKRTQAWHSTKATADAVYALLLKGDNPLGVREESSLVWGEGAAAHVVKMDEAEAGIGYVTERLSAEKVGPALAALEVTKTSPTLGWGAIHWQYFANLRDVTSATSGVRMTRDLLKIENAGSNSATGTLAGEAQVGDTLRIRITIDSERDYEYVHLKDLRGAGFEPEAALSGYRKQDDLWYYEMPRDTGTSFFIDYLPKGKHVFEYTVKVQHAGEFDAGYAELQCLYAPEFGARSPGIGLFRVKGR
jgi:hypothetical protein